MVSVSSSLNLLLTAVMINCETDFVAKNADFVTYVQSVLDLAVANKAKNADELKALKLGDRTVEETVLDQTGVIGEKIQLGQYEVVNAESTYAYIHPGNRIATIAGFNKAGDQFADCGKDVVMQIAAMSPVAIDKENVSQAVVDRELEIGKEQARQEGKPEAILEKIALGKLNKFYRENTLLNQDYIKDTKKSVSQFLKEAERLVGLNLLRRLIKFGLLYLQLVAHFLLCYLLLPSTLGAITFEY